MSWLNAYSAPGAVSQAPWWFAGPPRRSAGVDVLLIEDDRDIAEMYRRRLAADGLNVVIVGDAASGIAFLRQGATQQGSQKPEK